MKTKEQRDRQSFLAHFPKTISPEIQKYVDEVVVPRSRFIFTRRVQGIQFGYCTSCNKDYVTEHLQEGTNSTCTKCNAECAVKASGRGRKFLDYHAYVVYYEKSKANPKAITATGYFVSRDYRHKYTDVQPVIEVRHRYLFEPGLEATLYNFHLGDWRGNGVASSFFGAGSYSHGYGSWTKTICHFESIREAVIGTPFQYSGWEQYVYQDMVKFFGLFCKYPCIEYLTKLGMKYFVDAKMYGHPTYGAINWRGKTIQQVLKISKQQFKEIQPFMFKKELHPLTLRLQQITKTDKSNIPLQDLQMIANRYAGDFENLKKILKYTSLHRADNYIVKQKKGFPALIRSTSEVIIAWKDYIAECLKLEMDLKDDIVLFPRDLHEAHQQTIEKVKYKEDKALNVKIANRLRGLIKKFQYSQDGLLIRPIADSVELFNEGKKLKHCVGGYAKQYADGSCVLLAIRLLSRPNEPFYTMEIVGETMTQCRGFKNCEMTPEVRTFVDVFISKKLPSKQRKRVEVTNLQPDERQEVAI